MQRKFKALKDNQIQESRAKQHKRVTVKKKVVYNNSSKKLTEEQMELLALGLNFGLTQSKFPLVEYETATEDLCQKLEKIGDAESIEKARMIRNEVFLHLKVLRELKEDDSIIICPADKGKAVVIEDRDTYMAKSIDQIHEGNYELVKKGETTILRGLHKRLMDQLIAMGIEEYKDQRRYTVTGPVMASMALLIKVHKKNFPGRAYVSQIDDPSYNICKVLTDIINPIDESGRSFVRDTYHFKEMLSEVEVREDDIIGSLDVVGMFPNIPVKKTLDVVKEELQIDETLTGRTDWKVEDISKLL